MRFTADAMAGLQEQPWLGNVRELRNAVERLMLLATSDEVTAETVAAGAARFTVGYNIRARFRIGRRRPARRPRARLRETNHPRRS
jgi:DNA-binding NtrC family response regulator